MFDSCWIVYWLGLHSNTGYFQHNKRLGLWSKLAADERGYGATAAISAAIATAQSFRFVLCIDSNALTMLLISVMILTMQLKRSCFQLNS